MKKLIFISFLTLLIVSPNICFAASATDAGPYDSGQETQAQADKDVKTKKQDSQTQTSLKNRILGGIKDFVNDPVEFLTSQKTSKDVNKAFTPEKGASSSEGIPDGEEGSNFIKTNLLPSNSVDGKDGLEAAGLQNTSKAKKKRERALVETATFGYALAAVHKNQASRNLSGKKSIDKTTTDKTNKTSNYSASVSDNTNVKMSSLQIFNAIILTNATNNMITAISSGDYISNTNSMLNDMFFSSFSSIAGSALGSLLD